MHCVPHVPVRRQPCSPWKCNHKKIIASSSLQRWCCITQKISGQDIVTRCLLILIWVEPALGALLPLCQGNTSGFLKQHWVLLWTQSTVNRQAQVIACRIFTTDMHTDVGVTCFYICACWEFKLSLATRRTQGMKLRQPCMHCVARLSSTQQLLYFSGFSLLVLQSVMQIFRHFHLWDEKNANAWLLWAL